MLGNEQLYFKDLEKYDLIPLEEEKALLEKIQQGDEKSLQRLLVGNLRFVVSIARRYRGRGLTLLELINEGNIGLHKAAKRFDPSKEVKFISYAVWWIRQTIQKALFDQVGSMRIPANKIHLINKFKKALSANEGDYEKTLNQKEFVNYRLDIVELMEKVIDISLDAPVTSGDKGNATLLSMIAEGDGASREREQKELRQVVNGVLEELSEVEKKVLCMYYGINYSKEFTLEEIGHELKLTRERIRQIKIKALKKILDSKDSQEKLEAFSGRT
jgi:RNA polymerase primary sigma factor